MRRGSKQHGSGRRSAITLCAAVAVLGLFLAAYALSEAATERRAGELERDRWEARLAEARRGFEASNRALETRLARLDAQREAALTRVEDLLEEERAAHAVATESRVLALAAEIERERGAALAQSADDLRDLIVGEAGALADDVAELEASVAQGRPDWPAVVERAEASIYLVHTRFRYRVRRFGSEESEVRTESAWGTAFAIDSRGHLITAKHVVQPWKFDADLQALIASGDAVLDRKGWTVAVWPANARCLTKTGQPDLASAETTDTGGRLRVLGTARDVWKTRESRFRTRGTSFEVHALDDSDLALLHLGGQPTVGLPLRDEQLDPILRLEPVLTLGFPRGRRGLEEAFARTSPSLGNVRKAERTLHVTASIIPGNSGGPLLDAQGRVLGVATRVYSETLGICLRQGPLKQLLAQHRKPAQPLASQSGR